MNKIESLDSIITSIADIRNLREGFVTNFFLDVFKHQIWIDHGIFFFLKIGNTLFLIKKNKNFWNVFYASISEDEIIKAFTELEKEYSDITLMVDIVGAKHECEKLVSSLKKCLPYNYCRLVRMSLFAAADICNKPSDVISFAQKRQVDNINSLLNTFFDDKAEQIPYLEELRSYAEKNHILIYEIGERIVGFIIFEMSRMSLYLRYWFVHPDFRGSGIGSNLIKQFFYVGRETKRQQLWVICSNYNAIKRYVHYGFKEENLFDYVITNKNIEYERENNKDIK
jgi:ribosomal protein S18 acetylase RimI-like enzyme